MASSAMRRALTSWTLPEDQNFTTWAAKFDEKISKFCDSEKWYHSGVHSKVNENVNQYFDGLAPVNSSITWHDALVDGSIMDVAVKVGPIILIILGLIFAIASCVFAFCFKDSLRSKAGRRCCRDFFVDRPRQSYHELQRHTKFFFLLMFGALGVAVVVIGIVSYVYTANMIRGVHDVNCDAWLTFQGQFFGAGAMTLTDDVRGDWKGTVAQANQLAPILNVSNPARPNALYDYVWGEYQVFKSRLVANSTHYCNVTLPVEIDHLVQVRNLFANVANSEDFDFGYEDSVQWVAPDQTQVYIDDLWKAQNLGISIIEKNIEILLGEQSPLLARSYGVGIAAKNTLEDVDHVFGGITSNFEHTSHLLNVGIYLFASIVIVNCSIAIIWIAVGSFVFFKMSKEAKNIEIDRVYIPRKWMTKLLYHAFVSFMLLFSLAFLSTGVAWLLGKDGAELCAWVREDLGVHGNWASLDPKIWNETLHNTTDMELVLDTCATREGSGDIISSLGIKPAVEDLRILIRQTEDALRHEVLTKLDLRVKGLEAGTIKTLFYDLNSLIWQSPDKRNAYWPETLYVVPFVSDFPVAILCVITAVGSPPSSIASGCQEDFSVFTFGMNILNDKINSVTSPLVASGNVVNRWCSKWLDAQPNFECLEGATIIDESWNMERVEIVETVAAVLSELGQLDADRVETGLNQLVDFQKFLFTPHDLLTPHQAGEANYSLLICEDSNLCCANPSICTMDELLSKWRRRWVTLGDDLWENFVNMNAETNYFLENVTIQLMEDLLDDTDELLNHFDCQFAGTSLQTGIITGLCDVVLPSAGFMAIWLSLFSICSLGLCVLFFRLWHYFRDQSFPTPTIPIVAALSTLTIETHGAATSNETSSSE